LGWDLTDENGSFTFDAGFLADKVDIRVYCHNSVLRVLDGGFPIPTPVHQVIGGVANGDTKEIPQQRDFYRILATSLDVYDTVWRQFRPFNRDGRGDFPLGRKDTVLETFEKARRIELSYPDLSPAPRAWVEPAALNNGNFPLVHIKHRDSDGRLFGEGDSEVADHDPSLLPHELGHAFHFAVQTTTTRQSLEAQFAGFILTHLSDPTHQIDKKTVPAVAFIEAAGHFSERFFFFRKRVEPQLSGEDVRRAFFRDELRTQSLRNELIDPYFTVGTQTGTVVTPVLTGPDSEAAVYGAIYLDFARRVGLREAVGLVLDSNASTFAEFKQHVAGRGNESWRTAIGAVATTWGM